MYSYCRHLRAHPLSSVTEQAEHQAAIGCVRDGASASVGPRPQPRRLILKVDSPAALGRGLVKTKRATISIPELADEASPPPWGWTIAVQDRFRILRCTVLELLTNTVVRLETEVPPWMRGDPAIVAQVSALRALLDAPNFSVVIHEHVRWPTAGGGAADDSSDDDEDRGTMCSFQEGAGEVQEVFGDPGFRPSALPSLDLDGVAAFILSGACRSVALLTGAGISTASGIPDYRGSSGLWKTVKPERLTATSEQQARIARDPEWVASIELFKENPLPLLEIKRDFIRGLSKGFWRPTAAHYFVRLLHDHGLLTRVLTQNIDGLHQDAGVPEEKVTEIHGTTRAAECTGCGHAISLEEFAEIVGVHIKDIHAKQEETPRQSTPGGLPCPKGCGQGILRPKTILFGEPVNPAFASVFREDLPGADLLIVAGTSVTVAPAGKAPAQVAPSCVRLVVNDRRVGENAGLCFDPPESARDIMLEGDIDTMLVELAHKLGWLSELSAYRDQMAPLSQARL